MSESGTNFDDTAESLPSSIKVQLDTLRVGITQRLAMDGYAGLAQFLEMNVKILGQSLALRLESWVATVLPNVIYGAEDVPANWWQHLRKRWYPHRILRRWPVKVRTINTQTAVYDRVCPHVSTRDSAVHLRWLAGVDDERPIGPGDLRGIRVSRGLSVRRCAHLAGLDSTQLSRFERGIKGLSFSSLARLAEVLELDHLAQVLKPFARRRG